MRNIQVLELTSGEIEKVSGAYTAGQYADGQDLVNTASLLGWGGVYGAGASVAFWAGWQIGTWAYNTF